MKKTKVKLFKVIATILAACGITATFTACYGCPEYNPEFNENEVDFTVFYDTDGNGTYESDKDQLIKDIKISEKNAPSENSDKTDETGNISLFTDSTGEATFVIEDVDGDENGGKFKSKEVSVDFKGLTGEVKQLSVPLELE